MFDPPEKKYDGFFQSRDWLRHPDNRQACVQPILPSIPQFSADERGWVDIWVILHPSPTFPVWAYVFRDPMQWPLRRLTVVVACPCVGRRRGWKRLCARSRAQTYSFFFFFILRRMGKNKQQSFSSPRFHVFSYASCVDLTQMLCCF